MEKYDAIIIGAGQSGMPMAKSIAKKGLKVALIEKRELGGTCINDGCSPTKTMVASARVAHLVSRASDFGVHVDGFHVDQKTIKSRKDHIVQLFRGGAEKGLEKSGNIDIVMGKAEFKNKETILVHREKEAVIELSAEKFFINTGSEPIIPGILGLEDVPYLTSTSIMELEETPEHLIILGGGYVGLEFGQMFRRFGSKVTLMDMASRLVPKEDEDVCKEVASIFNQEDIATIFDIQVEKASYSSGEVALAYNGKEGPGEIKGTHLLVSTGRKPSTAYMGLEEIGVKLTKEGYVSVDKSYRSSVDGIYALGEAAGSPPFTHMAYHDAHLAFQQIYEGEKIKGDERAVPYCVFIDPQLARIGLNEQQAKEKGLDYKVGKFWMKHAGRALEVDETNGFFKVLVDPSSKKILGATVLSIDGGEIMAVIQMAMLGEVTYDRIRNLPIAHPTLAENLNNLMWQIE